MTQYFNSLNSQEKGRNFIDWDARFNDKMASLNRRERMQYQQQPGDRELADKVLAKYRN